MNDASPNALRDALAAASPTYGDDVRNLLFFASASRTHGTIVGGMASSGSGIQ
eukprot:CAMPEP_0201893338 /NCGR_PEP_ID=MMETSP0902-20130614/38428_1 /ASSEMBLY_ACC=CAM_ASM_000551 /TAXON_ID=420261 /ORGANISM="Thalassiosira antarctica, Strain CCMP982" /LENGTH=52 /DNA_ID=CAMNT_0048425091 /DNA_START=14 /DNA_END=172 /DNA_ORIENTATION=+